ncbi:MAG TPA: cytochrome c-type biogenesis CcmF C-terminal domain-containing protein, partial [Ilumatobacteraceae bacterium]|nr:cytochrome c-type biogenesis CcmF C-terminal domain-containing protein [Ilumatobacteraceae bacterium]
FAAGAAGRQLVLATRRQGWRGLVGRANGGMVVHLGIIVVAVALVASTSYTHSSRLLVQPGVPVSYGGHTFEVIELQRFETARTNGIKAQISIDGGQTYAPALTTYTSHGMVVPTPSVRTGLYEDIYLALEPGATLDAPTVAIKVFVKPMIIWLWIGGLMTVVGTLLSAYPGQRRRRPTDPTSAPIDLGDGDSGGDRGSGGDRDGGDADESREELAGV